MPERALYTKQLCSCVLYNNFDLYTKNPTTHLSHDERLGSNLPNIPTLCLMLLQFLSSAADGHKINAAEYQYHGTTLDEVEMVHSQTDGHDARHDRLDIVVHTSHRRAQTFLPHHNEHITENVAITTT